MDMEMTRMVRRRETSKLSQQRYRNRKKEKERDTQQSIDELNTTISQWRDYRAAIVSGIFLSSTHRATHQHQMVSMYMDLYSRGAGKKGSSLSNTQCRFLQVNCADKTEVNESSIVVGPDGIHDQWVRYSTLHPHMTCTLDSVEIPTSLANVVVARYTMELSLHHRSIMALYPHMASNSTFLEKTMGKTLTCEVVKTFYFNELNKIVQLNVGYDMLQPWCNLLQDMEMAVEVITCCKMKTCLIDMDHSGIEKAIDLETKQKRIEAAANCRRGRPRIDSDYTDIDVQPTPSTLKEGLSFLSVSLKDSPPSPEEYHHPRALVPTLDYNTIVIQGREISDNKGALSFILD